MPTYFSIDHGPGPAGPGDPMPNRAARSAPLTRLAGGSVVGSLAGGGVILSPSIVAGALVNENLAPTVRASSIRAWRYGVTSSVYSRGAFTSRGWAPGRVV